MTPGAKPRPESFYPDLLAPLQALSVTGRVRVALSGGLDSMVLLHLAHQVFGRRAGTLSAIHINHQLQPAASDFETACCHACEQLGVPLEVVAVTVPAGQGSVETAARDARYQAFAERLAPGDRLLMAHHGDDQAETLLFRFLRGTGVKGLAGIPATRPLGQGVLVRPLLGVSREGLEQQATAAGIGWVEDPTNAGTDYDRNFLRHRVLPLLRERWPGLGNRLAATARACGEAGELADLLARSHFRQLADGPDRILVEGLQALPLSARRNLLQWWLGNDLERTLSDRELEDLLSASEDATPEIRAGALALRRYRGHLYRVSLRPSPVASEQPLVPGREIRDGDFTIYLRGTGGQATRDFRLAHRQGGERVRERSGGRSRPLKKWLQEQGVPPWQRDRLPLVYRDGELVAVADLWCAPALANGVTGDGMQLEVRRERDDNGGKL